MTTLYNAIALLWTFIKNPSWIAVIKVVIDLIGSDGFKSLLDSIQDALEKESADLSIPDTETGRIRLLDRVRARLGLDWLGMTKSDYADMCRFKDVSGLVRDRNSNV